MQRNPRAPLLPLVLLCLSIAAFYSAYVAFGLMPPESVERFLSVMPALFLVTWVALDARAKRCVPCHDFAWLVLMFLPVSAVWYVLSTRGSRGVSLLLGLGFLFVLPALASTATWMLLHAWGLR
jgi:hypothetical protein